MSRAIADVHAQVDGRFFVFGYSRDTAGFWVSEGLPTVVENAAGLGRLGEATISALFASTEGVVAARNFRTDTPNRELLAWVGVETYGEYAKGVRSVKVHAFFDEKGGVNRLLVTPETNHGWEGFTPKVEHRESLEDVSAEALGAAIERSLELATP
ncbi:hypothetical protein AB0N73_09180 [Microbacterium sp. NPDC089189]|uniref:hypothetical protein n=1 Tax=Microbacterium sp. NPDC089189 TaxID=3154972 RepID=UPI0034160B8B